MTRSTESNPAVAEPTARRLNGTGGGIEACGTQYLTFVCDQQEYGTEILRVQEIRGWDGVTRIPHSAASVLGVINLRGTIVPIVDLRRCFELEPRTFDASTVVIVVHLGGAGQPETVGLVVDAVSEVYSVPADAIRPTPELGTKPSQAFVSGIAMVDRNLIMLLDIDKLVGPLDVSAAMAESERLECA
jgi:purine-binding chemotaxis protein CheW